MDVQGIVQGCAEITLEEEEARVRFGEEDGSEIAEGMAVQYWQMVGRFLTDRTIKFDVMRQVMASVWRPLMGIQVAEIQPNLYLFTFYHDTDLAYVLDNGPWAFENATLICQPLRSGEHPTQVLLNTINFWVQAHDLPVGYRTEKVLEKVGDFLGLFVELDERNFVRPWTKFYRVKVTVEVSAPLKRQACVSGLKPAQYPFGPSLKARGNAPAKAVGESWLQKGEMMHRGLGFGPPFSMSILSWNCRGLANPKTGREIMDLVSKKKPEFVHLMETMVDRSHVERLRVKLGFEGGFGVDSMRRKGGMGFLWAKNNSARLMKYSHNHIDLVVSLPNRHHWRLTCYYGFAQSSRRREAWDFLKLLKDESGLPWVVLGDFDDLLTQAEKRGRRLHPERWLEGFGDALEDCGLSTLPMLGYPYTWEWGKGTPDWVEERLDRAVADAAWRGLHERLRLCGRGLKKWGGEHFHKYGSRIEAIKREMNSLSGQMDLISLGRFRQLDGQLSTVLLQEESFWKQRAKQHWLQGADRNTKFYNQYATHHKRKNSILRLNDGNGEWKEGDGLVSLVDTLTPRVSRAQNDDLLRPFEPAEVKDALFAMGKDKSPGPDGMNPGFYQAFWDLIGKDFTNFVLACLSQSSFPPELNDANMVLIPKKAAPELVTDLRPIALCNVVYKVMAKMIANRMKPLLDGIVSESQSAFLPGRLISDNILIASEVGHYLRRKQLGQVGWAALKLDMAKAYDRMEWRFVKRMLLGLGFDARWVDLIMLCVRTVRYRVLVNGRPSEEIFPTMGLRQGDPLSPYLFIICAEGLSLLLQDAQTKGRIHGCRVARGAPPISHLFFADGSLLFFKANMQETTEVKRCLEVYEQFSGQSVNYHKSNICFNRNTALLDRDAIAMGLGVEQAEDFGKYLGLPSVVYRNRKVVFSYVEQKLRQRFGSWNNRLLSMAGKEVLLKSVAQAMPTYTMSIFLLPVSLCASLERLMNREAGLAALNQNGFLNARIFKARYYRDTTFYEASLGGNPSYVWRSIMASQSLIRSGCRRRIGDGRTSRLWSHPWLPDPQNPFVLTDHVAQHTELLVSDLLDHDQGKWNHELVTQLFDPRDVELIFQIPVSVNFKDDWFWKGDIRGQYTVKDGYRCQGELSITPDAVWNNIWKLRVPPKWRIFLWKALSNILPTITNLVRKRVEIPNICPACGDYEEDIMHILCTCIYARRVWNVSRLLIPNVDGYDFVQEVQQHLLGF
ncbi:PREDICTED: uncharacterized protein LOC109155714 [Ipomoea nil]|uniref:uncharacterized protein LOC109155714 n=1 Tax=Ipomoea nil TaxID=35883 RepID=UPI000901831E|nr:PREDICTED: uncharacterized protein LOC109155714 [Ipomoea nil]